MNIYLIKEDDVEDFYIKANTMSEAINISETLYVAEELGEGYQETCIPESEKEYYHRAILKSCQLMGVLKN